MVAIKKKLIYLQFPGGRGCHGIRAHRKFVVHPEAETEQKGRWINILLWTREEMSKARQAGSSWSHLGRLLGFRVVFHCLEASWILACWEKKTTSDVVGVWAMVGLTMGILKHGLSRANKTIDVGALKCII